MKHLLADWPRIKNKLKGRRRILFLDYDGTLTRLVAHPDDARLTPARKKVLNNLARSSKNNIALVSGRSMKDLPPLFSAPGIFYAGNHGLEIKGPGISFVHTAAHKCRSMLAKYHGLLERSLKPFSGVCVENKGLSLSVHYRACRSRSRVEKAHRLFLKTFQDHAMFRGYRLGTGKKVWEMKPDVPWHKGEAVKYMAKKIDPRAVIIYIGDDMTDEDAFPAVGKGGLAVKVGRGLDKTKARYFLRNPGEVFRFLKKLESLE